MTGRRADDCETALRHAETAGFGALLGAFLDHARAHGGFRIRADGRAVNLKTGIYTPVTVRWRGRSGPEGLWVGLRDGSDAIAAEPFGDRTPPDFGQARERVWRFGYLRSVEDVARFWGRERPLA